MQLVEGEQMLDAGQIAELERCRDRWAAMRLSTAPLDRPTTENAVAFSYQAVGLAAPRMEWCGSPIELARSWERMRHLRSTGVNVKSTLLDAVRDRAGAKTWWQLSPETRRAVFAGVRSARADGVCAAVAQAVIRGARAGRAPLQARLRQALISLMRRTRPSGFEHNSVSSATLDWVAPYQFLHDVCGLKQDSDALTGLWQLAANSDWIVPHRNVCWLSERPVVLAHDVAGRLHRADGPALRYPDGWSVYSWKGVEVPARLIEHADAITLEAIDRQPNFILRRCMIEILGTKRFLALGGAWIAGRDETGTLWRKTWRTGDTWAAVEVENGTPEPDGSRQRYILQVPPDLPTPRAAVAWTYGMSEREYRALSLRT